MLLVKDIKDREKERFGKDILKEKERLTEITVEKEKEFVLEQKWKRINNSNSCGVRPACLARRWRSDNLLFRI